MDFQDIPANYAETEIPPYDLPALVSREETLRLFADHVYGHLPIETTASDVAVIEDTPHAVGGRAHRRQLRVQLSTKQGRVAFDLLLYLPPGIKDAPCFVGLNFKGNHAVETDPAILLPSSWTPGAPVERGAGSSRLPVGQILAQGFGVATIYCGDFAPDDPAHYHEGVFQLVPSPDSKHEDACWGGAIAAWAWGLSRAREVLSAFPEIDPARIAGIGHSRLGKAALWAGACDERFSLVISNESGCGGAALSRRRIGERVVHITTQFPYWFAPSFRAYNEREENLPVDQHQLLAAIAPRGLYVSSAAEDQWADPRGEYLSLVGAAPAWGDSLTERYPALDSPVFRKHIGYHVRSGKHDITSYDWAQFLVFAKQIW